MKHSWTCPKCLLLDSLGFLAQRTGDLFFLRIWMIKRNSLRTGFVSVQWVPRNAATCEHNDPGAGVRLYAGEPPLAYMRMGNNKCVEMFRTSNHNREYYPAAKVSLRHASRCELITQGTRRFCWSQIRFLRSLVSLAIIKSLAEITCCGWSLNVRFCSCLTRSHHWTVSRWSTNLLPLRSWHFLAGPIQYKTNYSLWFQPVPRVRACILPVSIPVAHFLFLFLRAM